MSICSRRLSTAASIIRLNTLGCSADVTRSGVPSLKALGRSAVCDHAYIESPSREHLAVLGRAPRSCSSLSSLYGNSYTLHPCPVNTIGRALSARTGVVTAPFVEFNEPPTLRCYQNKACLSCFYCSSFPKDQRCGPNFISGSSSGIWGAALCLASKLGLARRWGGPWLHLRQNADQVVGGVAGARLVP